MVRALAIAALCLLVACGERVEPAASVASPNVVSPSKREAAQPKRQPKVIGPPPFKLRYDGQELELRPFTWCYGNTCADGFSSDPPSIGSPAEVEIFVPVERFKLTVGFSEQTECGGRSQRAEVEPLGDGWYRLVPHGHQGTYRISLSARGDGDMHADFLWDTPTDGPLAAPRALLYDMNDYGGETTSDAFELFISNLGRDPEQVTARVTITAANGQSVQFEPTRRILRCAAEGALTFNGPEAPASEVTQLGRAPFLHRVVLTIDGVEHVATATYPEDQIDDGDTHGMPLDFEPPLPALR